MFIFDSLINYLFGHCGIKLITASHVVNWSAKVLHEARGSLSKVDRDDVIVVNDAAVATENKEQVSSIISFLLLQINHTFLDEMKYRQFETLE